MTAATATPETTPSATRNQRRPMSLRVALLAQRFDVNDDPLPTDVMVYRQPLSDVPVPAAWRQPASAPPDSVDVEDGDDDAEGTESDAADASVDGFERRSQPRRIADRRPQSMGPRLSVRLLGSAVTRTLAGWVWLV